MYRINNPSQIVLVPADMRAPPPAFYEGLFSGVNSTADSRPSSPQLLVFPWGQASHLSSSPGSRGLALTHDTE
jgi:hypothetical protein